jgi:acyl carrier protein
MTEITAARSDLESRVFRIVGEVFGLPIEQVTMQTNHDTVKTWDSLNLINLLMAIEVEFGVSIDPEEATELLSVELIIEVLREKKI